MTTLGTYHHPHPALYHNLYLPIRTFFLFVSHPRILSTRVIANSISTSVYPTEPSSRISKPSSRSVSSPPNAYQNLITNCVITHLLEPSARSESSSWNRQHDPNHHPVFASQDSVLGFGQFPLRPSMFNVHFKETYQMRWRFHVLRLSMI